jgi:hypothetical protein
MYALNLLGKAVLITPPEILLKTGTNNNLDSGKLLPSIEVAETRFLQKPHSLGRIFYAAITAEKNQVVTSGNKSSLQTLFNTQATATGTTAPTLKEGMIVNASEFLSSSNLLLWNEHLWKYTAECCRYIALGDNYVSFDSAGLIKNNPIGSVVDQGANTTVGASLADLKYLQDNWLRERIEPLRVALVDYMTSNGSSYPSWTSYSAVAAQGARQSAYVDLSIYRDQDMGLNRGCSWQYNNPTRRAPDSGCCDDTNGWESW